MKNILMIVENLPVPLDRRVWQEACALRDAGYHVTVVCPQMRGFTAPHEIVDGITIYRHWISGEAGSLLGYIAEYATALWGEFLCTLKAWRTRGFDVIHLCNPPDLLFLIALPYKLLAGVKVVFDVHDLWPEMYEAKFKRRGVGYALVRLAERLTLAFADVVIATNESVRDAVKRRGRKADDTLFTVRSAPHGLETNTPTDPSLKRGKQHLIGYIGVMGDADGVDFLLHAAAHIIKVRHRHDVQFILMGSGPEYQDLLRLREELQLHDHVDMPGRVSNAFLFTGLKTMDLGVACDPINAYNDHCTMNKTLEYMAFAKPQVMFGTREGMHSAGASALCVMENSSAKLGDAILELLDDPARREQMGQLGHARLTQELNWQCSVEQLLAAYERA
jgi:glycosyltransferase involved in cell wall biosynthesis